MPKGNGLLKKMPSLWNLSFFETAEGHIYDEFHYGIAHPEFFFHSTQIKSILGNRKSACAFSRQQSYIKIAHNKMSDWGKVRRWAEADGALASIFRRSSRTPSHSLLGREINLKDLLCPDRTKFEMQIQEVDGTKRQKKTVGTRVKRL